MPHIHIFARTITIRNVHVMHVILWTDGVLPTSQATCPWLGTRSPNIWCQSGDDRWVHLVLQPFKQLGLYVLNQYPYSSICTHYSNAVFHIVVVTIYFQLSATLVSLGYTWGTIAGAWIEGPLWVTSPGFGFFRVYGQWICTKCLTNFCCDVQCIYSYTSLYQL